MNGLGANFIRNSAEAPTIASRRGFRGPLLEGIASDGWRSSSAQGLHGALLDGISSDGRRSSGWVGPVPEGVASDGRRATGGFTGQIPEGIASDGRRPSGGARQLGLPDMWGGPRTPPLSPSCRSPMDRFYDPYLMSFQQEDLPTAAPQPVQTNLAGTEEASSAAPRERAQGSMPSSGAPLPEETNHSSTSNTSTSKPAKLSKNKIKKSHNKIHNVPVSPAPVDVGSGPMNGGNPSHLNGNNLNGRTSSCAVEQGNNIDNTRSSANSNGGLVTDQSLSNPRVLPAGPRIPGPGLRLNVSQQAPPLATVGGSVTFSPDTIDPADRAASKPQSKPQKSMQRPAGSNFSKSPPGVPAGPVSPDQMARLSRIHKSQAPPPPACSPPGPTASASAAAGPAAPEAKPSKEPKKEAEIIIPKTIFVDLSGLRDAKELKHPAPARRRATESSGGTPESVTAPVVGRGGG